MNIEYCKICPCHQEEMPDSVVCKFNNNINDFIIDGKNVISCPEEYLEIKKIS
jgi:hypothetical protein